jgi:hypothetical protein
MGKLPGGVASTRYSLQDASSTANSLTPPPPSLATTMLSEITTSKSTLIFGNRKSKVPSLQLSYSVEKLFNSKHVNHTRSAKRKIYFDLLQAPQLALTRFDSHLLQGNPRLVHNRSKWVSPVFGARFLTSYPGCRPASILGTPSLHKTRLEPRNLNRSLSWWLKSTIPFRRW